MISRRAISIVLLLIVMAIWGSTFVVTKGLIVEWPPLTLAFVRVALSAIVLLPIAHWRLYRSRRSLRTLPWRRIFMLGLVGVAFYYLVFNLSLSFTTASQGALVQSSIPAMVALIAVLFFNERASRRRILGIGLSIAGVVIVCIGSRTTGAASDAMLGNLLMFSAVIAWGIYTSLARQASEEDPVVTTAFMTTIGALLLLPAAGFELSRQPWPHPDAASWWQLSYLAIFASAIAFLLYNQALKYMEAGQVGVFTNLIPVVGVISGAVVLHEPLSVWALIGGAVVLAGVWITGGESGNVRSDKTGSSISRG